MKVDIFDLDKQPAEQLLDYDVVEGIAITEEVSGKFGKEKILVKATEIENLTANMELIEAYASGVILDKPDEFKVLSFKESTSVPFYVNYNKHEKHFHF